MQKRATFLKITLFQTHLCLNLYNMSSTEISYERNRIRLEKSTLKLNKGLQYKNNGKFIFFNYILRKNTWVTVHPCIFTNTWNWQISKLVSDYLVVQRDEFATRCLCSVTDYLSNCFCNPVSNICSII